MLSKKWKVDKKIAKEMTQGFLDPYGVQSEDSQEIFKAFLHVLKTDPRVKRFFQKRYRYFKKFGPQEAESEDNYELTKIIKKVLKEAR